MLIKESLSRAKAMGFKAVVIMGYPSVYTRLGFKCTKEFNITHQDCSYPVGLMALELVEGYFRKDKEGMAIMPTGYEYMADDCL